jgi:hypothetical protein
MFALRPAVVAGLLVVLIALAFFGLGGILATVASYLFWLVVLGGIATLAFNLWRRRASR